MEQDTPVLTQKQQFFQVPKLQIWPLAKYIDKKKFGKWLDEIGIKYTKIKKVSGMDFGSVSFEVLTMLTFYSKLQSPEVREQARKILNDVLLDGKPLRISDPTFKKRSTEESTEGNSRPNKKQKAKQDKPKPECIQDVVTPLWKMTYEQQIELKTKNLKDILHKQLIKKLKQDSKYDIPSWVSKKETSFIPIEEVKTSPEITGYRNKCTFTIGYDNERKPCLGFVYGKTEEDKHAVSSPLECSNVSEKCKDIRNAFQDFITNISKKSAYDKVTQLGFWRSLVVKTFSTGDVLVVVQVDTTNVSDDDLMAEKEALINYCKEKNLGIKSLSWQYNKGVSDMSDEPCQLIMGEPYVYEILNGLKFQISAAAFFQVNTSAAQVLYKLVTDWCDSIYDKITQFKELSLVFDVCCGTGTIGLTIAKTLSNKVNKVIGVELSEDAIKDAKVNAELNDIKNINFICGKAEEALGKELRSFVNYAGIAIIDPPRAGLHPKTIKALRSCSFIKYIIFVSCDTRGLLDTTSGLCRSSSKTMVGEPFKPVKASAVDLFPGTETLEVVLLLER